MQISVLSHRDPEWLDLTAFERLAAFVLDWEDVPDGVELSVAVVDVEEMAELNGRYCGKDGSTDVLAFPCDDPCMVLEKGELVAIGDVVIAPQVAEEQAVESARTVESELNLLLVHGVLHLLGYDHGSDEEAAVMQAKEQAVLAAWEMAL